MSERETRAVQADNARVILIGVLADPALRAALGLAEGRPVRVSGALSTTARAGIDDDGWPVFDPASPGEIAGVEVGPSPALDRYARIMGLRPLPCATGQLLGVQPPEPTHQPAAAAGIATGTGRKRDAGDGDGQGPAARPGAARDRTDGPQEGSDALSGTGTAAMAPALRSAIAAPDSTSAADLAPAAPRPALAAAIAAAITAMPEDVDETAIRRRLPMIGVWAASQLRAADSSGREPAGPVGLRADPVADLAGESCALPPDAPVGRPSDGAAEACALPARCHSAPDRVRILSRAEPYAGFFAVEELRLTHRLHGGGWSVPLERAVFVSGDAVVVLPWDPVRDRVLVIDQFRAGPAARRDPDPWLIEPVAGRIDAGETPESTAHREALEEAGLTLRRLIPAPGHYPSPAILGEYLYGFIGITDLLDDSARIAGLATEGEDIRGQLMPRARLTQLALQGRLANGPLILLALWLDRMADDLRGGRAGGRARGQGEPARNGAGAV